MANHYKQRWHIEINFNSLKTIMSMDHLRSKTLTWYIKKLQYTF
ncbi:transposase [Piscirickettsia salmonis]